HDDDVLAVGRVLDEGDLRGTRVDERGETLLELGLALRVEVARAAVHLRVDVLLQRPGRRHAERMHRGRVEIGRRLRHREIGAPRRAVGRAGAERVRGTNARRRRRRRQKFASVHCSPPSSSVYTRLSAWYALLPARVHASYGSSTAPAAAVST